ncbi:phenylalanyl-tRNA synthetase subunit alpha [Roseibium aggregatum]|uniref:Phenylalanyl-tRNA synthetase subunit alpha n=1 Tax=Roseibium aggregatum TaxID=187304 RepID=A0A926P1P7_9HYPH|nr:phenylalanyl-tRNA synthetase subunit alpha [Roseibium aggregatum]MBD1544832.1 phenylalanyl-tRNA synthetase subunit alpha [Roseibium aggregatum]
MTLFIRAIAVVFLTLVAVFPANAQKTEDRSSRVATPTSFVEACAEKSQERGRLRFCDTYFRQKLGTQADALLYLRDRITRLRASHEASAAEKYDSFLSSIYIVAFLTICSMVLVAADRKLAGTAKWATLTSSAALLVVIVVMALGWLGKYRAEYAAQVELGILRDRIEAESAQVISTGQTLTPDIVREWTRELTAIGRRFADNYANATPIPEISHFQGQ